MNNEFGYALAFMTGLLGAGHCLGMCSGLAGGFAAHQSWRRLTTVLAYHGSRIAVYVLLGAVGAALGRVLVQSGALGKIQGQLIIVAGVVIVLLGLGLSGLLPRLAPTQRSAESSGAQPLRRMSLWRRRLSPLLAGVINGLVPCSLVFSVAIRATAGADPLQAGLLMLCFGLGTLPAMGAVTALSGYIGHRAYGLTARLAGVVVIGLGAWTVYEGVIFYQVMSGLAN